METLKREKIGKGYWMNGYGRGFNKNAVIWLINGKAYAKTSKTQYHVSIPGYIMVNAMKSGDNITFAENGIISDHKDYKKITT